MLHDGEMKRAGGCVLLPANSAMLSAVAVLCVIKLYLGCCWCQLCIEDRHEGRPNCICCGTQCRQVLLHELLPHCLCVTCMQGQMSLEQVKQLMTMKALEGFTQNK